MGLILLGSVTVPPDTVDVGVVMSLRGACIDGLTNAVEWIGNRSISLHDAVEDAADDGLEVGFAMSVLGIHTYGDGDGDVDGDGDGDGYGYGDGDGNGYGYGDGNGYGHGYGNGYGQGYSNGDGDGDGI
jgi:hypothetical protein